MLNHILIFCLLLQSHFGSSNANHAKNEARNASVTSLCSDTGDESFLGKGFKCKIGQSTRNCILPQKLLCDRVPDCDDGSDLCFDEDDQLMTSKCFQCLNGQVVSLNQVCDSVLDCDDFSDECLCANNGLPRPNFSPNPVCDRIFYAEKRILINKNTFQKCALGDFMCSQAETVTNIPPVKENLFENVTCIPKHEVCNGIKNCKDGSDEQFCPQTVTCENDDVNATSCDGRITCSDYSDECRPECWNLPEYCRFGASDVESCQLADNSSLPTEPLISFSQVCDGNLNCTKTGADEAYCLTSTHFYCWTGNVLFVKKSSRFNQISDCQDRSDECSGLFNFTEKSADYEKRNELIRYPLLQILLWVVAGLALSGNIMVVTFTSRELWKDREVQKLGRLAKCNRTLVLNLAVADFMMGFALLILAIQSAVMSNKYCSFDRAWRSGRLCVVTGMMMQCSSQTSVLLLILMTSYRLYGTLHPFKVEESKLMGGAVVAIAAAWLVSISIAILPQARFTSDYFTNSFWFPLPTINHDLLNRTDVEKLVLSVYTLSSNDSRAPLQDLRWRTMIEYLKQSNLTVAHPSWDRSRVVPLGVYNRLPLCQPFFYSNIGEPGWLYMTSIVFFNFLAFAYIAFAYLVIYKASSRPCVRKSVRRRSKQWRNDNRKMQKKIFCLVFTDMACWLPICVMVILNLADVKLHPVIQGVTGILLLPLNSALNPIVYSNIFSHFFRSLNNRKSPLSSSIDTTNSIKGSIGSLLNIKSLVNGSPRNTNYVNNNSRRKKIAFSNDSAKTRQRRVRFSSASSSNNSVYDEIAHLTPFSELANGCTVLNNFSKNQDLTEVDVLNLDMKESEI